MRIAYVLRCVVAKRRFEMFALSPAYPPRRLNFPRINKVTQRRGLFSPYMA